MSNQRHHLLRVLLLPVVVEGNEKTELVTLSA